MKHLEVSLIASLLSTLILAMPASEAQSADVAQDDQYGSGPALAARVTSDVIATEGSSEQMNSDPVTAWYKTLDERVEPLLPTPADKVVVAREINDDADRLKEYLLVTYKMRNNYIRIARIYREMPLPAAGEKLNELRKFKKLSAEWYEDAAFVCHEMIRPRQPCQTIEELEEVLQELGRKSDSLEKTASAIAEMDASLRQAFKVPVKRLHLPKES